MPPSSRFAVVLPSLSHRALLVGSVALSALPLAAACDDGPSVPTDVSTPNGAAARSGASAGGGGSLGGSSPAAGNTAAGGNASGGNTAGGNASGGNTAGGNAAAGAGGFIMLGCEGKNPAGCVSTGCGPDEMCTQASGVCVPSGCSCQDAMWVCTPDCGGGFCAPADEQYHLRLGFRSGQQAIADICVAYDAGPGGEPIFPTLGFLTSHFYTPKDFDGLTKLTSYIDLQAKPVAYAFTSTGDCKDAVGAITPPASGRYHTLLASPFSGETMQLWALTDSGPFESPLEGQLRVINALVESNPVAVTATTAGPETIGTIPFGTSTPYVTLSVPSLQRLDIARSDGTVAKVDFTQLDTIGVSRTTIVLTGTEGSLNAIVCNDARPDVDFFGGEKADVFSYGCLLVEAE